LEFTGDRFPRVLGEYRARDALEVFDRGEQRLAFEAGAELKEAGGGAGGDVLGVDRR
jgi:hypothetical protein